MENVVRQFLCILFITMLAACGEQGSDIFLNKGQKQFPVYSVIDLQPDSTWIILSDFYPDVTKIEQVSADASIKLIRSVRKDSLLVISTNPNTPPLSLLTLYIEGLKHKLVMRRSRKIKQVFRLPDPSAALDSVQIAGDFNGWNPGVSKFQLANGIWTFTKWMNPGKYAYRLVLNGSWKLDPSNADSISNGMGGYNSCLRLGEVVNRKAPKLFADYTQNNFIQIRSENFPENYIVLWDNFDITSSCNAGAAGVEIVLPEAVKDYKESRIRVFAWNRFGIGNDVSIPLRYGKPLLYPKEVKRTDREAMSVYFMMVDRFCDGDKGNNFPVPDKGILPKANYMGGDLNGIRKKVQKSYFQDLGFNTIWVSPVVKNPPNGFIEYPAPHRKYSGYHGYWPVSFTKVDNRFGGDKAMIDLVNTAHKNDLNVLVDFVSNHVHQEHPMFLKHPEWFSTIDLPDGRKNIRLWDEHRLTTWFDTFLPDIDFTKKEAVEAVSDSALYWIQNFKVDGFRHDATKHVSEVFWRCLTKKIKANSVNGKQPFQIGETFGSRELIGSYVNSGQQDAQFDFNFYFDARDNLIRPEGSFESIRLSLQESWQYYGHHHLMGNISGNHDLPRMITLADGDILPGEDEKEVGWKRNIQVENKDSYKKASMLWAIVAMVPGVPVLYYGDEFGMPGAGDPDNRRMMKFNDLSEDEKNQMFRTRELMRIRNSNPALLFGDVEWLRSEKDVLAFGRYYFSNGVFAFYNKSDKPKRIDVQIPEKFAGGSLHSHFDNRFFISETKLVVELAPWSYEIISNEY